MVGEGNAETCLQANVQPNRFNKPARLLSCPLLLRDRELSSLFLRELFDLFGSEVRKMIFEIRGGDELRRVAGRAGVHGQGRGQGLSRHVSLWALIRLAIPFRVRHGRRRRLYISCPRHNTSPARACTTSKRPQD